MKISNQTQEIFKFDQMTNTPLVELDFQQKSWTIKLVILGDFQLNLQV